jgi:hypothetical protein
MIWEFMEVLADPEDFAVKVEKDGSISLRSIYDLKQDGYHPKGASRFTKAQPNMLAAYEETDKHRRDARSGISENDEGFEGQV